MTTTGARILLVDDEEAIQKLLRFPLEKEGYHVVQARDGQDALDVFAREPFDLVILDLMLPKVDGMEVCRRLRANSTVPIIMLTAKGDEFDKVLGLEIGADDYITKDRFSLREFRSRVRAQLRRADMARQSDGQRQEVVRVADLEVDVLKRNVTVREERADLTYIEFELLKTLISHPGRVYSPADPAAARLGRLRVPRRAHGRRAHPSRAREDRGRPQEPGVHLHGAQHRVQVPRVLGFAAT